MNSSAANFRTAVNGAPSGTLNLYFPTEINHNGRKSKEVTRFRTYTLKGSLGSEVSVTLKDTFPPVAIFPAKGGGRRSGLHGGKKKLKMVLRVSTTRTYLHKREGFNFKLGLHLGPF